MVASRMDRLAMNPYEASSAALSLPKTSRDLTRCRTVRVCGLLAVGVPLFVVCTVLHSCMCGHLQHSSPVKLPWHIALDVLLGGVFLAAAVSAFRSSFEYPPLLGSLLTLIYLDHVILANGGGYFFILFDAPILIGITIWMVGRWRRIGRTSVAEPESEG